jgi:Predicted multitransmembrane protein
MFDREEHMSNHLRRPHLFKPLLKILLPAAILGLYCIIAFFCSRSLPIDRHYGSAGGQLYYARAKVVSVDNGDVKNSEFPGLYAGSQTAAVRMLSGKLKGRIFPISNVLNNETNYFLKNGQEIVVSVSSLNGARPSLNIFLYAPYRAAALLVLLAIFVAALCLVGGWRGYRSVLGIVFTLTSVFFVFLPMLFQGVPTIAATILLVLLTACVTLFLVNGISRKTFSAILGVTAGVIVSAVIMISFGSLLKVSGYTMPDTAVLLNVAGLSKLQVEPLLFAGIVIASLGAVMDIAISIAASVSEVAKYSPQASFRELFGSGMNVGRDMMGTMVNTLILAFVGSSLAVFILYYSYMFYSTQFSLQQVLNSDDIAAEILQAVCGSLSVILSVPIVCAIAAKLLSGHPETHKKEHLEQ